MVQMMSAVATKTMQSIQAASNASDYSELIANAFQNLTQVLKKQPDFYSGEGCIDAQALFGCACFALHLPESDSVKAATSFLTHVVSASTSSAPSLAVIVRSSGQNLVKEAVVVAVTSDLASDKAKQMTNIFFYLAKHYHNELCQWLQALVAADGFPGPAITKDKKEHFANQLIGHKNNKRKMQDVVLDFAATCISLQGTTGK